MISLTQIQTFIAVVECHSFAAAARRLGVSAPAVSIQIAGLESVLATQLIQRTTRKLILTDYGRIYYEQVSKGIDLLKQAEQTLLASSEEPKGDLVVTANRHFATTYLLPRLPDFIERYPLLKLELELAERFPDLASERVDLIFGVSMPGLDNYIRKQIDSTRYVLSASPAYLAKRGTPLRIEDLGGHDYIGHSMRVPNNRISFDDQTSLYLEPKLLLNDSAAICQSAIKGLGLCYLHEYIVREALDKGTLVEILPKYTQKRQAVYLYYLAERYVQAKIRHFIDFFVERSEADPI